MRPKNYREALRIRPDFFEAHFNLGNLLKSQGLLPEAREAFEVVLAQRPDFAEAIINWPVAQGPERTGSGRGRIPRGRGAQAVAREPTWVWPT